MENTLLAAALHYAKINWFVFPCREKDGKYFNKKLNKWIELSAKQPRTPNGLDAATINIDQIKTWWTYSGWENSCIGINCGKSKLLVIDVDMHSNNNGIENFEKLLISHEKAWHSFTCNGGMHIVFSDPNRIGRSSTNSKLGIDTRGSGGFIVAPPSCIYDEKGEKKCYIALDDWNGNLQEITPDSLKKLGLYREKEIVKKDGPQLSRERNVLRVRNALNRIPFYMCDNYSDWLSIGMALYSLGTDGLILWKEWSRKSSKYTEGICEEKWDTFQPDQISLGTIFYKARESNGQ